MNEKQLETILGAFLQYIYSFSDQEYQQRAWVNLDSSESIDMEEWMGYFLSLGEGIIENIRDFKVNPEQAKLLTHFYGLVVEIDKVITSGDHYFGEESVILELPKWKAIVDKAQEVMDAFGNPFRISGALIYKLDRFTDKKMQREYWLKDGKPSQYFKGHSDSKVDIDYVIKWTKHFASCQEKYGYSDEQVEILNKLHEKLKAFPYDKSNLLEFIDSDEWKEIGELSKQALELFKDVPAW